VTAGDPRSDEELVKAANAGDAEALGAIYLRYRDWALSLAFRFTGDREAAQDVAQEAFAYLLSKFPGFRLRARLTTFLYPAIKNTALAARRKKRAVAVDDEHLDLYVNPSAALGPDAASRVALGAAVSRLPVGQREVLLMRTVDDMSLAEIALALGIPEGTVKSRMHHAIAALREDPGLRGYFEPEDFREPGGGQRTQPKEHP
jgi:RNA polymerase sigma-70 factor, ECF subfamily